MPPLSLLAVKKVISMLTTGDALQQALTNIAGAAQITLPQIATTQIAASSAGADLADKNIQLSYPRICLYTNAVQNKKAEKFRSFSGAVSVVAEIWASTNLLTQTDEWIHFYVEAFSEVLRSNVGDWGDGFTFTGKYDVQFQPPKAGGFGFVACSKVTLSCDVSLP
ncbi:MAG: hypothetical protein JO270_05095 [Acidobacteriaceae bacterium]|nr:hypothetical protein [Acidobacteriaceae bacterium]MBV8573068.1 hypothetical protein [Acidobacteriaceae bacterium]